MSQLGFSALEEPWPAFLDEIDRNTEQAFEQFYAFARRLLELRPPSVMRAVPTSEREDLIHDVILHCCDDNFRVLRRYSNQGRPFAAWFSFVARNKIINLRGSKAPHEELNEQIQETRASLDESVADRMMLQRVVGALRELSRSCQILLQGAADGLKPRQLTRLLGLSEEQNKKASDDLRACRTRLRKLLQAQGIEAEALAAYAPAIRSGGPA